MTQSKSIFASKQLWAALALIGQGIYAFVHSNVTPVTLTDWIVFWMGIIMIVCRIFINNLDAFQWLNPNRIIGVVYLVMTIVPVIKGEIMNNATWGEIIISILTIISTFENQKPIKIIPKVLMLIAGFILCCSILQAQPRNVKRIVYQYTCEGHPTNSNVLFPGLTQYCTALDVLTDSLFQFVNSKWVYSPDVYGHNKGAKGDKGDPGAVPVFVPGNTITLAAGSPATMVFRSLGSNTYAIDAGLPKGYDGTGGGGLVQVDNLYYLFTTMNFSPTIVTALDTVSKFGLGLFVWIPWANWPSVTGDIINRGNGCWARVGGTRSGELFNTAWVGYQDIPYRGNANSISSYPGSLTQAQINIMFGTGYDRTKDTYPFLCMQYSESIRGKQYYSVTNSPAGAIYYINRTVTPQLNYETLPGHWVGDVSGDRRTVGSNFRFNGNFSTILFNHTNGGTMVMDAWKDFNLIGGNANARTVNWSDMTFWGTNATDRDTGLHIDCANNNVITNCNFNGLGMGLHLGFAMHSKVINNEFSDIRNIGCQWDWESVANGSASKTPCNGSIAYGNHIVGGVGGKYGFVSHESDGSHWDRTSGEGAGTGVHMMALFNVTGKTSTCKGGNFDGIRAEANYSEGIVKLDVNESNWDVQTVWSQANNVMIDAIGNGSAVISFKDGKYPDGSQLKFRLHSPFTNIRVDYSFNTWTAQGVQYMTDLGGFVPNPDRQDVRSFRYQNFVPTAAMARETLTTFGNFLNKISPFKTPKEDHSVPTDIQQ